MFVVARRAHPKPERDSITKSTLKLKEFEYKIEKSAGKGRIYGEEKQDSIRVSGMRL